ncbi:transporter [Ktedonobacter sp. SOSP1-85]|uniref:ABC transporter permease subunit n=1 Tax=Ktedonobacter sp. SOSP1-85 TaxID=2778367 RepID=UPI0019154698|nr:ABC transporter permease subunit [Ktedonobacter sp. SOSP1-85]GHO80753.1 transporter [Ktedonobacter sp. SOSP1-85]
MTWLTWRQYRVVLLCAIVALTLYALAVVIVLNANVQPGPWYMFKSMVLGFGNLWPQLIGLIVATFIGAPLIAREREQGTHHLAWTQGIARTRWLAVKLGLLVLVLVILSIGFALLANKRFEFETNTAANHSMITVLGVRVVGSWRGFFFTSIVPVVLVVFALMLGVAVGCFVRRNVPAMTIAFTLFLVVFLALTNWYAYLLPPRTYIWDQQHDYPQDLLQEAAIVKMVNIDQQGNEIKNISAYCHLSSSNSQEINECIGSTPIKITYQPEENYWPLQWIVSGILLVLSLGLGVVIFIRVRSSVD